MKCLSVHQPWATLIVKGLVEYDVRSWQSAHRGPLAIHTSQKLPKGALELCRRPELCALLDQAGYAAAFELPRAGVIGVVQLIDVLDREAEPVFAAPRAAMGWDDRPGRFLWQMAQARALPVPIQIRTLQGVFDIPDGVIPAPVGASFGNGIQEACGLVGIAAVLSPQAHTI